MTIDEIRSKADELKLNYGLFTQAVTALSRAIPDSDLSDEGWCALAATLLGALDPRAPVMQVLSIGLDEEGVFRYAHPGITPAPAGKEWVLVLREKEHCNEQK